MPIIVDGGIVESPFEAVIELFYLKNLDYDLLSNIANGSF